MTHAKKLDATSPSGLQGFLTLLRVAWSFYTDKSPRKYPDRPIPVQPITRAQLQAAPDGTAYRLGHSSLLLKLRDEFWLTDPVFATRASPFSFIGPKRFHAPPIALKDLPPIKGVILSHDHFDHLDKAAIKKLKDSAEFFLCPGGVAAILRDWGVPAEKIHECGWGQLTTIAGVEFICTPSQHFSGRGLNNRNHTLWASWVIDTGDLRIFFSGDSGYFDGFRMIGEKYGPFDIVFMECGAYDVNWPTVHMQPEESLQAYLDVKGRTLVPIHNSTFCLARHAWDEPLIRITQLAKEQNVHISTPQIGEALNLRQPHTTQAWWI